MHGKLVWFDRMKGIIKINGNKITSFLSKDFISAVNAFRRSSEGFVTVNFSDITNAYPGGMLPIICCLDNLRNDGYRIDIILPDDSWMYDIFVRSNWAHWLDPDVFDKSDSYFEKQMTTTRFVNHDEQTKIVDGFVDLVSRSIDLSGEMLTALEWSVNEVTDNVLNHSNSENGGYFQAVVFPSSQSVNFVVADSGRGILNSLKEGYPKLKTDIEAISESVKEEITRDSKVGQGNGLFGTLSICNYTKGSFEILTGQGRFIVDNDETESRQRREYEYFQGTMINGTVKTDSEMILAEAIKFYKRSAFSPSGMIDTYYEHDDDNRNAFQFKMKDESGGFGNRRNGAQLRQKALNFLKFEEGKVLVIDWNGVSVISSSFADEFIGKLFLEMGMITFSARVQNVRMSQFVMDLLDKAASQRLVQARDEI